MSAVLFKWRGALCFVPLLFDGRLFCTNAHDIHWMIAAILSKCHHLILMSITTIFCHHISIFHFRCGSVPADSAPPPTVGLDLRPTILRAGDVTGGSGGREGFPSNFPRVYTAMLTAAAAEHMMVSEGS